MHLYPAEHVLSGPYKIYEYEPQAISTCLEYLTPDNMIMIVSANTLETDQEEKWYGTKHSVVPVDDLLLETWRNASVDTEWMQPQLGLPERNDMIATNFDLKQVSADIPKDAPMLIMDTETCRLWYKPDNVFDMPKVNFIAQLETSIVYESPESNVLASLWTNVLEEHCNEFTYLASMAGLHCYFTSTRTGVEIHVR